MNWTPIKLAPFRLAPVRRGIVLLTAASVVSWAGCGKEPVPAPTSASAEAGPKGPSVAKTDAPVVADPEASAGPMAVGVAKVGATVITAEDVRAKIGDRTGKSMQPAANLVGAALNALIDEAVLLEAARAAKFSLPDGAPDTSAHALASAFLAAQMNARPAPGVTDVDLAAFFAERRSTDGVLFATRAKASEVHELYRNAVAAAPESGDRVFADIASKVGLQTAQPWTREAYDEAGMAADGERAVEKQIAVATHLMKTVGAVTPPMPLLTGENAGRFALVRVTAIREAVDVSALTDAMRVKATTVLTQARRKATQRSYLNQLRIQVGVEVDAAQVSALERTVKPPSATQIPTPARDGMPVKVNREHLRRLLKDRRPGELRPIQGSAPPNAVVRHLRGKPRPSDGTPTPGPADPPAPKDTP